MRKKEKYSKRVHEWTKEREWEAAPRVQLRLMVMKIVRVNARFHLYSLQLPSLHPCSFLFSCT